MSEHYGFGQEISFGNHSNDSVLAANRAIRVANEQRRQDRQTALSTARANVAGLNTRQGEVDDVIKTIGDGLAGGNKAVGVLARGTGAAGGAVVRGAGQLASGVASSFVNKIPVSKLNLMDQAGVSARGAFAATNIAPQSKILGSIVNTGSEVIGGLNRAENLSGPSQIVEQSGEAFKGLVPAVSGGARTLEDTLKTGGQALSIGLGVLDAAEDVGSGKIVGNNTAERVSNVAGIAAGALEGAGLALDSTVAGAPVGVALNVLGGIAGLVSGGADIVGEEEEKKSAQAVVSNIVKTPAVQQTQSSFSDAGSAGVEVKN